MYHSAATATAVGMHRKSGEVWRLVLEMSKRTDRHTDMLITMLQSTTEDQVTI